MRAEKAGVQVAVPKGRMLHNCQQQVHVVPDTVNTHLFQRVGQRLRGVRPSRAVGDDFCEQRVVVRRDLRSSLDPRVYPYKWRVVKLADGAAGGQKPGQRVFGDDARLNGVAVEAHVILSDWQRLARRDA